MNLTPATAPIPPDNLYPSAADALFETSAVDLLIAHGRWLEREAFAQCCFLLRTNSGEPGAVVSWSHIGDLLKTPEPERDAIGSPTSWVILTTAHAIATDAFGWRRLDHDNRVKVTAALARSLMDY